MHWAGWKTAAGNCTLPGGDPPGTPQGGGSSSNARSAGEAGCALGGQTQTHSITLQGRAALQTPSPDRSLRKHTAFGGFKKTQMMETSEGT